MMHDHGKSDSSEVPRKPLNNAGRPATEAVEGSGPARGNSPEGRDGRTQRQTQPSDGIERVRQAARKERQQRFTALMQHVSDVNRLRAAYFALKRAAAGIEGETWTHYGEARAAHPSSVSKPTLGVCYPRQEPDAVVPHVRIYGGVPSNGYPYADGRSTERWCILRTSR